MNPDPEERPSPPPAAQAEIDSLVLMYGTKAVIRLLHASVYKTHDALPMGAAKNRFARALGSLAHAHESLDGYE